MDNLISCVECFDLGWILYAHQFQPANRTYYMQKLDLKQNFNISAKNVTFESCKCEQGKKQIKEIENAG